MGVTGMAVQTVLIRGNDFEEIKRKFNELHPDKEILSYNKSASEENLFSILCQKK
jgi:hypothetical protein